MSNLSEAMQATMEKIREMVDVNCIIGDPIQTPDQTTLIPVSKVSFGFASGGTDGSNVRYGAGAGAGVSIVPMAFVVVSGGNVRMLYIDPPTNSTVDKLVDMVPGFVDKFQEMRAERAEKKEQAAKEQAPKY